MNSKYEMRKRITIILWIVVSSMIFWLINFLPQTFDEGSFITYMFMFFGGGFAFHIFTEMLSAPANEKNWDSWGKLGLQLVWIAFTILLVFGVVYFEKKVYSMGGVLSLIAIFVAIWLITTRVEKVHMILYNEIKKTS